MTDHRKQNRSLDFELLFESVQGLYAVLNPRFELVAATNAYLHSVMLTRDEAIGRHIFELFPHNPNDPHSNGPHVLRRSFERAIDSKKSDQMGVQKYDIRHPATAAFVPRIWYVTNTPILDKEGEVIYIILFAEDVTEYVKLGEQEKNDNPSYQVRHAIEKAELSVIVEFTDDAIISKSLDGTIRTWNRGAQRLYGYTAAEVLGRSISVIFPPNHKAEIESILKDTRNGQTIHYLETERQHKNGKIIPVSVSISPIRDPSGKIIGACSIAKDITEWKHMQHMKDEFISMVSHELRTPLTSIQGSLTLLQNGVVGGMPPQAKQLLEIATNNSERLIRLINDILDIEKIESGKMDFMLKPESIEKLVKEAIRDNESFGNKFNVKIKMVKSDDAIVNVDHDRMIQVLTNLISNAVKFSKLDTDVSVSINRNKDKVRISVANYGAGIPKAAQPQLFQKFAQISRADSRRVTGTGLGLNISKQIVEKLNGSINFTSDENETVFYFELPIYRQPVASMSPRLLICEDDEDAANYLKVVLEQYECEVLVSYNAQMAKEILAKEHIDALLLDIVMPGQDGISFIKELRASKKYANLPIVVISVKATQSKQELNGSAFNVLNWINKPVSEEQLTSMVTLIKSKLSGDRPQILHVEDDMSLLQLVASLMEEVADVVGVTSLERAREEIKNHPYDLIILDLMLTDGNGAELLPLISKKHIPIVVFSAYDVPKNYVHLVAKHLTKSSTTTEEFFREIQAALKKKQLKKEEIYAD